MAEIGKHYPHGDCDGSPVAPRRPESRGNVTTLFLVRRRGEYGWRSVSDPESYQPEHYEHLVVVPKTELDEARAALRRIAEATHQDTDPTRWGKEAGEIHHIARAALSPPASEEGTDG